MRERNRFERELSHLQLTDGTVASAGRHPGQVADDAFPPTAREAGTPTGVPSAGAPVLARILWPALGFPAVVAPRQAASGSPMLDGDATRCVCALVLSERPELSKADAARHLRYVPWGRRGRRHIRADEPGGFPEGELAVRNDGREPRLTLPKAKDGMAELIMFGGNKDGDNGITVSLANYVREFYRGAGLKHLHEIRVSETASRLPEGCYHLFWNNRAANEDAPSDEMALLLGSFARPWREELTDLWDQHRRFLLGEYEYEYGSLQRPYRDRPGLRMRPTRAEILHPVFVRRPAAVGIRIGHLTDTHVDVRADVYQENLKGRTFQNKQKAWVHPAYNNWNTSFVRAYTDSKRDSDVLLLTGDLIDYGRGHWGLSAADRLGEDRLYHHDRNWFLFYYLLAAGDAYRQPVYTILGNHDWRLNPYPPFAIAGVPGPETLIHDHTKFVEDELERILQAAHGLGYDRKYSYHQETDADFLRKFWESGQLLKTIARLAAQKRTLDEPHTPVETTVESVAWYLLSINPFFDYAFSLPTGHQVLMLDWAEDEDLLFPIVEGGEAFPFLLWQVKTASEPAPKAKNCLTGLQQRLVRDFVRTAGKAKVIGIHAPPISPYPDWYDYPDLFKSRKTYRPGEKARGPTGVFAKGKAEKWPGHPIFAVRPSLPGEMAGTVADFNSFEQGRPNFIKWLFDPKSGVRIVLSGHIHRNGLFVVHVPGKAAGSGVAGQMLVRGLLTPMKAPGKQVVGFPPKFPYHFPLYVNTTSTGPRGHFKTRQLTKEETKSGGLTVGPGYAHVVLSAGGAISRVEFRTV